MISAVHLHPETISNKTCNNDITVGKGNLLVGNNVVKIKKP